MKLSHFSMAHLRMNAAHGPEPLTATGAAQACPTCLPSPSHQLTFQDDFRPDCPLQKSAPFAPRYSAIGTITRGKPAFSSLRMPVPAGHPLICRVRDVWPKLRPLALAATANPANQLTWEGDSRPGCPLQKSAPIAPRHSAIGTITDGKPAFSSLPVPVPAGLPLICWVCDVWPRPRPLALAATANPANQLTWEGESRPARPLKKGVRFAPRHTSIGDSTGNRPAFILTLLPSMALVALNRGHCSGRRAPRVLGPSAIADAAMQRSYPESSGPIRPFIPSSLFPHPLLRAQRIGGFMFASPALRPPCDHSFRAPWSLGCNHPHSILELVHKPPTSGKRRRIASISARPTSRKDGCPTFLPFLELSYGFHVSKRPHLHGLPRFQTGHRPGMIHGPSPLPSIDSKRLAYRTQTTHFRPTFNRLWTGFHQVEAYLTDQARSSEVMQDSDFRRKITVRKKAAFSSCPPRVRRGPGFVSFAIRLSLREFAESRSFYPPKTHANTDEETRHAVPCGLHTRNQKSLQSAP